MPPSQPGLLCVWFEAALNLADNLSAPPAAADNFLEAAPLPDGKMLDAGMSHWFSLLNVKTENNRR